MTRADLHHHLPSLRFVIAIVVTVLLLMAAFVWFGVYNIAADAPHSRPAYVLLESLRDRSIAVHARGIRTPADLEAPAHVAAGAGLYAEMCQGCHLGPGIEPTEMAQGLYPQAPELAKDTDLSPAQKFWIIKHGVKLTAMPAWGKTHPDRLIWDMVAFLQKMPGMTPMQYRATTASAPKDHDVVMKDATRSEANKRH
ncbi:cytochrome c [Sphingomonas koreensis]|nr:cytochrome c [Sphingomonas koreensis]